MSKIILIDRSYIQRVKFPYTFPIDFTATEIVAATSRGGKVKLL